MPFSHPNVKQHLHDVFLHHSLIKPSFTHVKQLDVHQLQAFNVQGYSNK